jgi:hypothetical protein
MGSGRTKVKLNTNERAVSTDLNRLQALAAKDMQELFRALLNTPQGSDDSDGGGTETPNASQSAPVSAEVISGLRFQVTNASTACSITAGTVMMLDPDSSPSSDDSPYKYINDPGLSTGTLVMTANASGSTRIDIIECARLGVPGGGGGSTTGGDSTIETSSRDIFNDGTGLFSPSTVTKVASGRLQYRIRTGTPGSGIPAAVAGWLPLCVASVPNGSTNWDTVTLWDVRPLVSDREYGLVANVGNQPKVRNASINALTLTAVAGTVDATLDGRRVGGILRSGVGTSDSAFIDVTAAANQEGSGISLTANTLWSLYLVTPAGLPRWARYTATGTRAPRATRGIPVVSNIAPFSNNSPSSAISLPSGTGLGGATVDAVCVATGYINNAAAQTGFAGENRGGLILQHATYANRNDPIKVTGVDATAAGDGLMNFTLTAGTNFPANAKAILVDTMMSFATVGGGQPQIESRVLVKTPNAPSTISHERALPSLLDFAAGSPESYDFPASVWIEVPPMAAGVAFTFQVTILVQNGGQIASTSFGIGRVLGWKY